MSSEEVRKRAQVYDMMTTMHSVLSDRYAVRSKILEVGIFGMSIILLSTVFLDPSILLFLKIDEIIARIAIGTSTIIIFFMSLLSLIVDWKGLSVKHKEAFNALVKIKSEWRSLSNNYSEIDDHLIRDLSEKSSLIVSQLTPIPDKYFNKLKHCHYKKIEVSKFINKHPGSNYLVLTLMLTLRSSLKIFQKDNQNQTEKK